MQEQSHVERLDYMMRVLFQELRRVGGTMNGSDLIAAVKPKLELTEREAELNDSGKPRWEINLRFNTTDCVKAGYITKTDGNWTLTEKGEEALKLPPGELMKTARSIYNQWRKKLISKPPEDDAPTGSDRQTIYEEAKEKARKEIDERINELDPYEFQKLVAELLKAMGYHVPYTAPPGPDGGVDVIAYKDPLGTTAPRIKVQVKHRISKVAAKDVRELEGLLRKDGDIGLIVSSGGFTSEADREIRSSGKHIETMNLDRVISLWQQHYELVSEVGKGLLPLVKVYFLAPEEQQ